MTVAGDELPGPMRHVLKTLEARAWVYAEQVQCSKPQLQSLIVQGLVTCGPPANTSPTPRNRSIVRLTDEGRARARLLP